MSMAGSLLCRQQSQELTDSFPVRFSHINYAAISTLLRNATNTPERQHGLYPLGFTRETATTLPVSAPLPRPFTNSSGLLRARPHAALSWVSLLARCAHDREPQVHVRTPEDTVKTLFRQSLTTLSAQGPPQRCSGWKRACHDHAWGPRALMQLPSLPALLLTLHSDGDRMSDTPRR